MTSYNVSIIEGTGGYVPTGYTSTGYVISGTRMTDSLGRLKAATRSLTETDTTTDAVRPTGWGRAIGAPMTLTALITRRCAFTRQISQGTGGYTSSGYTETGYITDNLTRMSDTLSKVRNVPKTLTETVNQSDSVAKVTAFLRTVSNTLTDTDSISRLYGAVRTVSNTLTTTDTLSRQLAAIRTIVVSTFRISEILQGLTITPESGLRRLRECKAFLLKRSTVTRIFKRSSETTVR